MQDKPTDIPPSEQSSETPVTLRRSPEFRDFQKAIKALGTVHTSLRDEMYEKPGDYLPIFSQAFSIVLANVRKQTEKTRSQFTENERTEIKLLGQLGSWLKGFPSEVTQGDQDRAIAALKKLLLKGSSGASRAAAFALGSFAHTNPHGVVEILQKGGIDHADGDTAQAAMYSLIGAGIDVASIAAPTLCKVAQKHKDSKARQAACDTLRVLREKIRQVGETLVDVAGRDKDQTVRHAAYRALLGLYGLQATVEMLRKTTKNLQALIDDLRAGPKDLQELRHELQAVSESRAASGVRGRPTEMVDVAKFAKHRRERKVPVTWDNIFLQWKVAHPKDMRVTKSEQIRSAYRRHFGDKVGKKR